MRTASPSQALSWGSRWCRGGGYVFTTAVQSDANGIAANYWTLGTTQSVPQRIEVRSVDPVSRQKRVHGVFTATLTAGAPTQISIAIGLTTAGQVGQKYLIGVLIRDAAGLVVPGATVNWAVIQGNGSVDSTATMTNENGVAINYWTLGTQTVTQAVAATLVGVGNVVFSTVPARGPAATFVVNDSIKLIDPVSPNTLTGQAFDQYGNPVPAGDLYWELDDGFRFAATADLRNWDANGGRSPAFHRIRLFDRTGDRSVYGTAWLGRAIFAPLAAGRDHSCAIVGSSSSTIRVDGSIFCGGLNTEGQVGGGAPQDATFRQRSSGVSGRAVTTGGAHTCAIGSTNTYCWGANDAGQLGIGSNVSKNLPTQVAGNFYIVSAGATHTCAIDRNARAWCWGANSNGQLGTGNTASSNVPVQVVGDYRFFDVSAGDGFTCATTLRGEVYCWGRNDAGQLGDATGAERTLPVAVASDGLLFAQIDAGDAHVCAIRKTPRELYCWGSDAFGQIGDGDTGVGVTRRPARVNTFYTPTGLMQVSAGGRQTCAVAAAPSISLPAVFCWGSNEFGELGLGTSGGTSSVPAHVNVLNVIFASAGGSHSCALNASYTFCWGLTSYLRLMSAGGSFTPCGPGAVALCATTPRQLTATVRPWF